MCFLLFFVNCFGLSIYVIGNGGQKTTGWRNNLLGASGGGSLRGLNPHPLQKRKTQGLRHQASFMLVPRGMAGPPAGVLSVIARFRQLRAYPSQLSYNLDMRDADHLLQTGSANGYHWLVSTNRQLDVLECCPDVVLGKYVAITSFDSGALRLTEEQRSAGWVSRGEIAYSPEIQHVNTVPQTYFSELYVFDAPTNLGVLAAPSAKIFESEMQQGQVHTFVNYDFGFHDPEYADLAHMFWRQLGWMKAESYLAENDYLIFVTANAKVFAPVYEALRQVR
jgi:hypothetical protein